MYLEHRTEIAADAATLWDLTADIGSWPAMTPTVTSAEWISDGPIGVGSEARLVQPGQRPTVWRVTAFEPEQRFEWEAKVFGMHMLARHSIESAGSGCVNTLSLEISGGPTPVLGRLLAGKLRKVLATENAGFKRRAEAARRP